MKKKKYVKTNSCKQNKRINEIQKLRWDQRHGGRGEQVDKRTKKNLETHKIVITLWAIFPQNGNMTNK